MLKTTEYSTAYNSALAHMAGRRASNPQQIANQPMFQLDTTLLSYQTINEHLYIYSALVRCWTNNEYRHIANALTLPAINSTMPTLVHLADERDSKKILNAGIKVRKNGLGVYCMPVLPDFYITHQWLRELKRFGAKSIVGVYFKVDSSELVYAGKFSEPHKHITLGVAIKEIISLSDPLGYELIIDRKIEPKEITKIKPLPQKVGWRYLPGSNGTTPCTCEYCLRGRINGKRMKNSVDSKKKD